MITTYTRLIEREDVRRYRTAIERANPNLRLKTKKIKYFASPIEAIFQVSGVSELEVKVRALQDLKDFMAQWDRDNGY